MAVVTGSPATVPRSRPVPAPQPGRPGRFRSLRQRPRRGTVGNDMLGFSHTVLSSGALAFLGALWSISDEALALLMVYFFRALKKSKGSVSIARCWRTGQIQLYNADPQSVTVTLQDIIKQCRKAEKMGFVSSVLSKKFRGTLREVIKIIREEGAAYKHPFFWAPFALVGHGGLLI